MNTYSLINFQCGNPARILDQLEGFRHRPSPASAQIRQGVVNGTSITI